MSRPLMSRVELLEELAAIEREREQTMFQRDTVNPEGKLNRLACLDEWEQLTREDLARLEGRSAA